MTALLRPGGAGFPGAAVLMSAALACASCITAESLPPLDEAFFKPAADPGTGGGSDPGALSDVEAPGDPGTGAPDAEPDVAGDADESDVAGLVDALLDAHDASLDAPVDAPEDKVSVDPGEPEDPGEDGTDSVDDGDEGDTGEPTDALSPCEDDTGTGGCEEEDELRCFGESGVPERCEVHPEEGCLRWEPVTCDDGDVCTDDGCDEEKGCVHVFNEAECDDGNACTSGDACNHGLCAGTDTSAFDCDDGDPCTDDSCASATGCSYAYNTSGCDDENACTRVDTCDGGVCVGSDPVLCEALDQCHQKGSCDPATGVCSNPEKAAGTPCSDGNACTETDECHAGACVPGEPVRCSAVSQCHDAGECDRETGVCSNPEKQDGSPCDDGDECTTGDACGEGACSGTDTSARDCDDGSECTSDSCDVATGCANEALAELTPCDSGGGLRSGVCRSGSCVPKGYVLIPAGEVLMGSPPEEPGHNEDEQPRRRVEITRPFWLKATEVTQKEWRSVMGLDPSYFSWCGDGCPVERVSWWDSLAFCNALSIREGLDQCYTLIGCTGTPGAGCAASEVECEGDYSCESVVFAGPGCEGYRLPTEAEWELGARAGTTTAFHGGPAAPLGSEPPDPVLDGIGWYTGNAGAGTNAVGRKDPNAWGLFDVSGNVWEWAWDLYAPDYYGTRPDPDANPPGAESGSARINRGGSFDAGALACRSANRRKAEPGHRQNNMGFRPARTFVDPPGCGAAWDCSDLNACTADECRVGACWQVPVACEDQNPCTADRCDGARGCLYEPVADATPCDNGSGPGSGLCLEGLCSDPGCADGVRNGEETDVDCGGACPGCADGKPCRVAGDCASGECEGGQCRPAGFVLVPAGELVMGSPAEEAGRAADEGPQRSVRITRPYWVAETEVTQGQWLDVMGTEPSHAAGCGADCPVERVSWWDAIAYCNALSRSEGLEECYELTGCSGTPGAGCEEGEPGCFGDYSCAEEGFAGLDCEGYRLPTEAEWENAYRAGTATAFYGGPAGERECGLDPMLDDTAWYCANAGGTRHAVQGKEPNAWGLFDMAGNVSEWVLDWHYAGYYASRPDPDEDPRGPLDGALRVIRGGSFGSYASYCRAAQRGRDEPETRGDYIGFRPVRTAPPAGECGADAECDDGNACTSDECREGGCWHVPAGCDDGDVCTDDACDGAVGCVHTHNTAPCEDGNPCTEDDACVAGGCVPGAWRQCALEAGKCRHAGVCDPSTGLCTNPPKTDGTLCDDGDACTAADACKSGVCTGETGVVCDDGSPCTVDSCDPGDGCVHEILADGTGCDSGGGAGSGRCVKGACGPESFAFVPAGEFVMGSPEGELGREANEGPQRRVHVTHPYWLMATEVTQAEWREIMGTDPSYFSSCGDDCPVERVNWWDALLFCNALSAKHGLEPCYELTGCTGLDSPEGPTCTGVTVGAPGSNPLLCEGYRLSTEAEWEHARRAGTTTAFQRGGISHAEPDCEPDPALEDVAWYCPSSGGVTHAVKGKAPNGWGLFDMSGNVWEWVWDWYGVDYYSTRSVPDLDPLGPDTGSLRLLRGCSYENGAVHCRAAFRLTVEPDKRNVNVGLRPARTVLGTLSCASSADCDDSNACTADECREDGSCWHSPADCGDDDACTDVACDAATGCTYTPTDCDDSNPCTSDSCDSSAGCKHEALTDGTACDSGDGPGSGRCEKGACGPEGYLFVPAGELTMGSPEDEPGRDVAEGPRRRVHITTPFWLKTTEVTQAEWREVMNVGLFLFSPCGDDCPAEQVNFWDALSYCNALSEEHGLEPCYELEGCSGVDDPAGQTCTGVTVDTPGANPLLCEGYRLPTEAEWEYAYRAGTVTALYNGKLTNGEAGCGSDALADAIGWHCGNAESKTHPVMAKVPNAWGFFDMAGNVWEWAWDWYDPDYYSNRPDPDLDPVGSESGLNRILQGGSFTSPPLQCRAAYRFPGELVTRYGSVGLRPARSILSVASCTSPADCDDSNACTTDECREGSCWHLPRGCDDGNPCTDDSCDGATGCRHTNNAAPCDDGNACTGSSQCSQGVCVGADPVVCQPASQCHDAGVCDPDNGVCSNPAKQDGATCDDSEACTLTDVCDGGVCTGTNPKVCAALDQCHEPGTCDSVTGICSNPVKGDDAPCSDGDACSTSDTCKSGVCQPGPRIVCLASTDQCRDHGTCDAGIGVCVYPAKVEGTPCDDGNPCTTGDACTNGSCVGATAADCDDSNPCTVDSCDPSSGCKHEVLPDDTECDSGGGEASGRCRRGTCGPAGYVYVGPGTFMMGSPADELGRVADEAAHGVALTRGFWMKATEVTQAEWKQVMATEPSYFAECGGDCPVERVSWWDALAYCNALSLSEGLDRCYLVDGCAGAIGTGCAGGAESCVGSFSCAALSFVGPTCTGYRLPTEAEWEYAARAGTMTAVHSGDLTQTERAPLDPNLDAIAWYGGNSAVGYPGGAACSGWYVGSSTCGPHPVDEKRANDWGLKDTAGNIWEWVWDWYAVYAPGPVIDPLGAVAGSSRVFRGGSWLNTPVSSRAATRNGAFAPVYRGNGVGLRPVRTISDPPACAADADCDDANPCTVDACSESGRCWHVPNACDDGDSCTVDSCVSGVGCTHDEHQDGTACEITGASDTGVCLLGACKPNGYVRVPAGSFTMGSPETEPGREGHEGPQRTVQISRDYWLKQTEVTQGEWKALMGVANNPSLYTACGDDCPVEQVNWWEAVAYCNAMSSARGLDTCYVLSGCDADAPGHGMECAGVTVSAPGGDPLLCEGFRLPTEAEWERAYRAGTSTAFHNGALTYPECNPLDLRLTEIGWYCGNSEDTTNAVKGKTPNVWGFYDMAGNVWEWVWDRYDTSYYHGRPDPDVDPTGPDNAGGRILRGGSWGSGASTCRAAHRNRNNPESRVNRLGFRPARTVLPTSP